MPPDSQDTWEQYRNLILAEIARINTAVEAINRKIEQFRQEDISEIKTDIALLKFQAGLWGAGAGVIFSLIMTLLLKFIVR